MTMRRAWLWIVLALGLAAAWAVGARDDRVPSSSGTIELRQLPREARETLALIRAGGPFPYAKDGTVFGNRERLLPGKPKGYYREYTVRTPGERTRGARRIVCGGKPTAPDACWYTDDHYQSFSRILE